MTLLPEFFRRDLTTSQDGPVVPAIVTAHGEKAALRFLEFFTAQLPNPNTRRAYGRAVAGFCAFMGERGLGNLAAIGPVHVAAWVQWLGQHKSAPTVKQHLAAVRMLFDWLVVGQVVPANPAASVRGPKHSATKGKSPVLAPDEARQLLDAIPTDSLVRLRDRALIGVMTDSFARVSASPRQ